MKSMMGTELRFDDHNLAHDDAVIITVKEGKIGIAALNKT
jgi:hypothetical protein